MSGKRAKALRRELKLLLGRPPQKSGSFVPRYPEMMGGGLMQIERDEWRVYKRAYRATITRPSLPR